MKKNRNKKAIVITALLMFAGILLIAAGLYGKIYTFSAKDLR